MKKYELIESREYVHNHRKDQRVSLYRIRSLRDFGDIKCGDVGGYVESESNLSHDGDCWIYDRCAALTDSQLYDNAKIYGHSFIDGDVKVYDNAIIKGLMGIEDECKIYGDAIVQGNGYLFGDCWLYGNAILDFTDSHSVKTGLILDHGYWRLIKRNGYEYLISNTLETVKI